MIARGFKPIGWVAAVGTAALGCYMLSLRVASERADLTNLELRIVATRQQIRSLQTELGTRGRLQQLEQWNDEVLALAAPVSGQYLHSSVQLARFGTAAPGALDAPAEVRMAAAEMAPAPAPVPAATPAPRHAVADAHSIAPPPPLERPMVQRTSLTVTADAAPAPAPAQRPAAAPVRSPTATPRAPTTRPAHSRPDTVPGRPSALLDARTLRAIGSAARAERGAGGGTGD
jgi:hypothetical protein